MPILFIGRKSRYQDVISMKSKFLGFECAAYFDQINISFDGWQVTSSKVKWKSKCQTFSRRNILNHIEVLMNEFCNFTNWQDLEQRGRSSERKILRIHLDKEVNQWWIMDHTGQRFLERGHDSVTIAKHADDEKEFYSDNTEVTWHFPCCWFIVHWWHWSY